MKFKRRLKIERSVIDLTSLVNVFFLLFMFFMFTSSFIFQPGIRVSLPRAVTSEVVQSESATIIITQDDKIYMNERQMTDEEIVSNLRIMAKSKAALLLKADDKASLGRVVWIWDKCRAEGVQQISIATTR